MLKNYLKIAFRNLRKNKVDSFISIGGLAVGIACCILLVLYVKLEVSYNDFHENKENIYRVYNVTTNPRSGEARKSPVAPYQLAPELENTFPEFDNVIRIAGKEFQYKNEGKYISEKVYLVDPEFFSFFTFPLVEGDPNTALSNPNQVVITQPLSRKLFGDLSPIGKAIDFKINGVEKSFTISGVAKKPPINSSLEFKILMNLENFFTSEQANSNSQLKTSWNIGAFQTWVQLNGESNVSELENKFPDFVTKNYGVMAERTSQIMKLQPLEKVYFENEIGRSLFKTGNKFYTSILGGIAFIILAIAGINFISLTLSRASNRVNEIGIRVTSGAERKHISQQFFGEVFITCSLAFMLGTVLAELLIPFFQSLIQKPITIGLFQDPVLWLILISLLLLITLITGAYPAWAIPRLKNTKVNAMGKSSKKLPVIVKSLIVLQFGLSIGFLIFTITMQKQFQYILNKDLGYSPNNVIALTLNRNSDYVQKNATEFTRQIRQLNTVESASISASSFSEYVDYGLTSSNSSTTLEGFPDQAITTEAADEFYLKTLGIQLKAGEGFSSDKISDIQNGVIVNQSFVDKVGWNNPVGKIINDRNENFEGPFNGKKVIGVIEDFHYQSLSENLEPFLIQHIDAQNYTNPRTIFIKTTSDDFSKTLAQVNAQWDSFFPNEVFQYSFMDDLLQKQYEDEKRWNLIMEYASAVSILLACFGLFGLASLAAKRRKKEVAIRKVLGASITRIVQLLTKDFVLLVAVGFLIAVPVSLYFVNEWLQSFSYRIELGIGVVFISACVVFSIAILTTCWISIKSALQNPAQNLRNE